MLGGFVTACKNLFTSFQIFGPVTKKTRPREQKTKSVSSVVASVEGKSGRGDGERGLHVLAELVRARGRCRLDRTRL